MTTPSKPCRRWFQFRLRTLLVLMVLASIGLSWFAVKMQRARRQREAVEAITREGGEVFYYENSPSPSWLRTILREDLSARVCLAEVPNNTPVERIEGLANLRGLVLGSEVTDAGLQHLKGMSHLKYLQINGSQISDDGLEHLHGMTQLDELVIRRVPITDEGLDRLKGLPSLRSLTLMGCTRVSHEGIGRLRQSMPECRIDMF
jgi:hypothetical protein